MTEYIERDSVGEILTRLLNDIIDDMESSVEHANGFEQALRCVTDKVADIPSADVRPERHGRWVSWEEAGNFITSPDRYECSICHDAAQRLCNGIDLLSDYCPNCGAKMDRKDIDK